MKKDVINLSSSNKEIKESFSALGTQCTLTAYGKNAGVAIEVAKERIKSLENKFSVFKESSEVSKLNKYSGNFIKVSDECLNLIDKAIEYSNLTMGYFDITIGPLVRLWSVGKDNFSIPTKKEILDIMPLINCKLIEFNKDTKEIKLAKNQQLDFGAIAKGYGADLVKKIFIDYGVESAIINLGGNIVLVGNKKDGPWTVGIQDPFGERGEYVGVISLSDKSIVTSGSYERFSIKDNKLYSHIINSKTGYTINEEILSVSVISDKSIDGDGLSTGLFILGVEKSIKILEELNLEGIFITKNQRIILTKGLKDKFILTNNEFKIDSFK